MKLTDIEIRKAKPRDKAYRMSDGGGLYLRGTPSGGKLWRWSYHYSDKAKLMALGLSLAKIESAQPATDS